MFQLSGFYFTLPKIRARDIDPGPFILAVCGPPSNKAVLLSVAQRNWQRFSGCLGSLGEFIRLSV